MTTIRSRGSRWRPPPDITRRAATGRRRYPRDGGWPATPGTTNVGPDQIILRVAGDVTRATVTLSNGRDERLTLFPHPIHPGVMLAALVYRRNLDIHRIDLLDTSGEPLPDRL
jgi:hypothetical protein